MNIATIVVAPHADDAALSIGGILLRRALPTPVAVVTVFTRSNYTLSERMSGPAPQVTAIRKSEEAAFVSAIGSVWLDVDLPEAVLRRYATLPQVFGPRRADDRIHREVANKLTAIFARTTPSLVILPMGLGGHVDHIIVRETAYGVALASVGLTVAFFEDLPYAARLDPLMIKEAAEQSCSAAIPLDFDVTAVLRAKLKVVAAYKSQVGRAELGAVRTHALRLGSRGRRATERLWLCTRHGESIPQIGQST